jgi:hypothetical protein
VTPQSLAKQVAIVSVPVALEHFVRIVHGLERQKLPHLRVTALDLIPAGPAVVGEVVTAAVRDAQIDELPERFRGGKSGSVETIDVCNERAIAAYNSLITAELWSFAPDAQAVSRPAP